MLYTYTLIYTFHYIINTINIGTYTYLNVDIYRDIVKIIT